MAVDISSREVYGQHMLNIRLGRTVKALKSKEASIKPLYLLSIMPRTFLCPYRYLSNIWR